MKKKVNTEEHLNQNIRINELEALNRILQEKLKLLRIQLKSQCELQATVCNYHKVPSFHQSHSALTPSRKNTTSFKSEESLRSTSEKQYEWFSHQLNLLQEELQNVKDQNKNRVSETETQIVKNQNPVSPTTLKAEVNENVEIIKLKRFSKKQSMHITSLQSQLDAANSEIKQLQTNLSALNSKKENLQAELSDKKTENIRFISEISALKANCKLFEAQLKDLQLEKVSLKEHNENLLKLSLEKEKIASDSDSKSAYLKQIKELEENFRNEIIEKSELLSKLSNVELQNAKLQNEMSRNSSLIVEIRNDNSSLNSEIEKLKQNLQNANLKIDRRNNAIVNEDKMCAGTERNMYRKNHNSSNIEDKGVITDITGDFKSINVPITKEKSIMTSMTTEDKAVITEIASNLEDVIFKRDRKNSVNTLITEANSNIVKISDNSIVNNPKYTKDTSANDDELHSLMIQLFEISAELDKHKKMSEIKSIVHNKYKNEVKDFQDIFEKKEEEEPAVDFLQIFQVTFNKYVKQFSQINKQFLNDDLKCIIDSLQDICNADKHSQKDLNSLVDKFFSSYVIFLEKYCKPSNNLLQVDKIDVTVNTTTEYTDECVQVENDFIEAQNLNDSTTEEVTNLEAGEIDNKDLTEDSDTGMIMFELQIDKANFDYFSDHLIKSSDNNPRIFLTWNFLNDSECQAYTPTISISDGQFNCSCQYEGPFSDVLYNYLNQNGIQVEIHLVQGEISVKLGEVLINTSKSLHNLNEYQPFVSPFESPNVKGSIVGSYFLKCDPVLLKNYNS